VNKEIIIYDAATSYMLMVSCITAQLYRKDYHNILFLSTNIIKNTASIQQKLLESKIFDKVILLKDNKDFDFSTLKQYLSKKPFAYHMASYGSHYAGMLFNYCVENKIPIILNEEGMATYTLYDSYKSFHNKFTNSYLPKIDLDKISEIWVFNKSFYQSKCIEKVKEISFVEYISNKQNLEELITSLNLIFDYKYKKLKNKTIFFNQNLYDYGVVSKDEHISFLLNISKILNNNVEFKLHPAERKELYKDSSLNISDYPINLPWELVLLNALLHDDLDSMVFISIASTSLFSQYIFFHKNISSSLSISLFNLAPLGTKKMMNSSHFKKFSNIAKKLDNFFIPKSYEELNRFLVEKDIKKTSIDKISNPKISIIMPNLNAAHYIKEAIDSALNQTIKEIELICIDNNSSDDSINIIRKYIEKDHRVKLLELNKNYGSGEARNIGLRVAKGDYIAFLDSDDYYYSNDVLETLYNAALEKNVEMCGGNIQICENSSKKFYPYKPYKTDFFDEEKHITIKDYMHFGGYYRFIFKSRLIREKNIFFPDYFRRQDPVWLCSVMVNIENIYVLSRYIYVHRKFHKTVEWNDRQVLDALSSYKDNFKILKKNKLYEHYKFEFIDFKNSPAMKAKQFSNKKIQKKIEKLMTSIDFKLIKDALCTQELNLVEKDKFQLLIKQIDKFQNIKPYIIVGFGNLGQVIYKYLKDRNLKVDFIFDKSFEGLKVDKNLKVISTLEITSTEINFDNYTILNTILNKSFLDELQLSLPNISLV